MYTQNRLINHNSCRQKGVALITVLLIISLVTIISVELSGKLQLETRRTENFVNYEQALQYAYGAETFAITILQDDIEDDPGLDHLGEIWATKGVIFPIDNGNITGEIRDLNSCLNINSVVKASKNGWVSEKSLPGRILYTRLLATLELPELLVDSLVDWIDSDDQPSGIGGAEDIDYSFGEWSYRTANTLLADITELRAIQGYTDDVYDRIEPYVCALPDPGILNININTISPDTPELLMALVPNIKKSTVEEILANRPKNGYKKTDNFWELEELNTTEPDAIGKAVITVNSKLFMLKVRSTVGRGQAVLNSVLSRNIYEGTKVIYRNFGTME